MRKIKVEITRATNGWIIDVDGKMYVEASSYDATGPIKKAMREVDEEVEREESERAETPRAAGPVDSHGNLLPPQPDPQPDPPGIHRGAAVPSGPPAAERPAL